MKYNFSAPLVQKDIIMCKDQKFEIINQA